MGINEAKFKHYDQPIMEALKKLVGSGGVYGTAKQVFYAFDPPLKVDFTTFKRRISVGNANFNSKIYVEFMKCVGSGYDSERDKRIERENELVISIMKQLPRIVYSGRPELFEKIMRFDPDINIKMSYRTFFRRTTKGNKHFDADLHCEFISLVNMRRISHGGSRYM